METSKLFMSERMRRVEEQIRGRLRPNRVRESTRTCPAADRRELNPFVDEFLARPDEPLEIVLAHAIVRSWAVTPVEIFPDEALVGITRPSFRIYEHFSWGICIQGDLTPSGETRRDDLRTRSRENSLRARMNPLDREYVRNEGLRLLGPERLAALEKDHMFSAGGYQGHTVPSYDRLLQMGLDGMMEYVDLCERKNGSKESTKPFYEASRILLRGMSQWLGRYARKARSLFFGEPEGTQKEIYRQIAENCAYVAHKKPETLYQASQLVWCLSLWDWVDCLGRADQYLYPFYRRSVEEGDVIPAEDSVVSLLFKIWENGSHNVTLGGVKADGSDAANELSLLMLNVLGEIHDTHPRMSVRYGSGTTKALLEKAAELWSQGMSDPTLVSDDTVLPGLESLGIPLIDARDYTVLGCQEIEVQGKSNTGCEDGVFNVAKVLEYALYGGKSPAAGMLQIGPETPALTECGSFEEFFDAFAEQLRFFTEVFLRMCDRGQEIREANFAKLLKTPFTVGCLEKGKSHDMGGPVYNTGCVETAGTSAAADALTALKKIVFEEKRLSAERLLDALLANFSGYETERQLLKNGAPKFGNGDEEADRMAARVLDLFWTEIGRYRSVRGGRFTGACSLLEGGITFGKTMGAMPDGSLAGTPLGNTIGPRPGADVNGLTAMLSGVAKLPLQKGVGGTTLNVVLPARLLADERTRPKLTDAIETFLTTGGQMAQITTADPKELKDACVHPERHGDLIVRIGGFSIHFIQLSAESQREVISRYEGCRF